MMIEDKHLIDETMHLTALSISKAYCIMKSNAGDVIGNDNDSDTESIKSIEIDEEKDNLRVVDRRRGRRPVKTSSIGRPTRVSARAPVPDIVPAIDAPTVTVTATAMSATKRSYVRTTCYSMYGINTRRTTRRSDEEVVEVINYDEPLSPEMERLQEIRAVETCVKSIPDLVAIAPYLSEKDLISPSGHMEMKPLMEYCSEDHMLHLQDATKDDSLAWSPTTSNVSDEEIDRLICRVKERWAKPSLQPGSFVIATIPCARTMRQKLCCVLEKVSLRKFLEENKPDVQTELVPEIESIQINGPTAVEVVQIPDTAPCPEEKDDESILVRVFDGTKDYIVNTSMYPLMMPMAFGEDQIFEALHNNAYDIEKTYETFIPTWNLHHSLFHDPQIMWTPQEVKDMCNGFKRFGEKLRVIQKHHFVESRLTMVDLQEFFQLFLACLRPDNKKSGVDSLIRLFQYADDARNGKCYTSVNIPVNDIEVSQSSASTEIAEECNHDVTLVSLGIDQMLELSDMMNETDLSVNITIDTIQDTDDVDIEGNTNQIIAVTEEEGEEECIVEIMEVEEIEQESTRCDELDSTIIQMEVQAIDDKVNAIVNDVITDAIAEIDHSVSEVVEIQQPAIDDNNHINDNIVELEEGVDETSGVNQSPSSSCSQSIATESIESSSGMTSIEHSVISMLMMPDHHPTPPPSPTSSAVLPVELPAKKKRKRRTSVDSAMVSSVLNGEIEQIELANRPKRQCKPVEVLNLNQLSGKSLSYDKVALSRRTSEGKAMVIDSDDEDDDTDGAESDDSEHSDDEEDEDNESDSGSDNDRDIRSKERHGRNHHNRRKSLDGKVERRRFSEEPHHYLFVMNDAVRELGDLLGSDRRILVYHAQALKGTRHVQSEPLTLKGVTQLRGGNFKLQLRISPNDRKQLSKNVDELMDALLYFELMNLIVDQPASLSELCELGNYYDLKNLTGKFYLFDSMIEYYLTLGRFLCKLCMEDDENERQDDNLPAMVTAFNKLSIVEEQNIANITNAISTKEISNSIVLASKATKESRYIYPLILDSEYYNALLALFTKNQPLVKNNLSVKEIFADHVDDCAEYPVMGICTLKVKRWTGKGRRRDAESKLRNSKKVK